MLFSKRWSQRESPEIITCSLFPVEKELNLKKAAKSVGEKSIEMIRQKELLPLTGYIHGGCSPIGMKKQFITTVDKNAENYEKIIFSAGKIGYQVEITLEDLKKVIHFQVAEGWLNSHRIEKSRQKQNRDTSESRFWFLW